MEIKDRDELLGTDELGGFVAPPGTPISFAVPISREENLAIAHVRPIAYQKQIIREIWDER